MPNDSNWPTPSSWELNPELDTSRPPTALEQDSTIIAVIEMSQREWLVAALVPGVGRQSKKLGDREETLLKLLHRWRQESAHAGHNIKRIVVAYDAGRGFWLARWLRERDVEAYYIHRTSTAESRRVGTRSVRPTDTNRSSGALY
jgi:transposase